MREIEVSAKTRELAIKDALDQLGVERDEVHVEILDEGSAGLFGFGARNVRLKVSTDVPGPDSARGRGAHSERPRHSDREESRPREPRHSHPRQRDRQPETNRQAQPPRHANTPKPQRAPQPAPVERKPAPPERKPAPVRVYSGPPDPEAESLVREVIQRMGIEATISSATDEGGAVSVKIESPDSAILIGRKGRSLESLQYLVNRMSPKVEGEEKDRITVDIEGYLDRRQEALEELAHRLADRARETGRRQRTKPMGSQERRAIHMALEGDETIKTFSVGDAGDRHVVIAPKDERADGDRPPRGRGFRGDRDHGGEPREHRPRNIFDRQNQMRAGREPDGGGDRQQIDGNGAPRRRRRSRRGGRGRGPRPDAPAAPNDTVDSGPQES